jgi:hypothetical protein
MTSIKSKKIGLTLKIKIIQTKNKVYLKHITYYVVWVKTTLQTKKIL